MAKRELFDHRLTGPLMRSLHHIEVDRADGEALARQSRRTSSSAARSVGIFPEATISRAMELKELKTGAARIAAAADVPLVPVVLWGTQRLMTKDHPTRPLPRHGHHASPSAHPCTLTGDDPVADTAELQTGDERPARRRDPQLPAARARGLVAPGVVRRQRPDARRKRRGSTPRRRPPGPPARPREKGPSRCGPRP